MTPTLYVSTIGTSLLTNGAGARTPLLRETANLPEADLTAEQRDAILARVSEVRMLLQAGDVEAVRRQSAELNGLYALDAVAPGPDAHALLHTDTFQGARCAELVRECLTAQGCTAWPVCLERMHVGSPAAFAAGVDSLLRFARETIEPARAQGWRIVFNLVGGFKAVQAYCQTVGMFYADAIAYLFEGSRELIRIPRLPIRVDLEPLRAHAAALERLRAAGVLPAALFAGAPEALFEIDGENLTLSCWGMLCWDQARGELLEQELLEQPGIRFADSFRSDFRHPRMNGLRTALQEAVAEVSVLWAAGGLAALRRHGGLQYEDYAGRTDGVGHFRFGGGPRVSCMPLNDTLQLRRCGPHDLVNRHP